METAIPKNLFARLERLNDLRRSGTTEAEATQLAELEAYFDDCFSAACKLAVYGSLAPGQLNHSVVADIQGRWENGLTVRGELVQQGWGASLGFPALKWLADEMKCRCSFWFQHNCPNTGSVSMRSKGRNTSVYWRRFFWLKPSLPWQTFMNWGRPNQ